MREPSEETLTAAVDDIIRNSDLEKLTFRMIMTMLSEKLSLSPDQLKPQKPLVRNKIDQIIASFQLQNSTQLPKPSAPLHASQKRAATSSSKLNKPIKLTGLERAVVPAQPLADFLGEPVISRSHIPKRISAYAKQHDLNDPSDRRIIICDDALKAALSVDSFTYFSLGKVLSAIVSKPDESDKRIQDLAKKCEQKVIEEKLKKKQREAEESSNRPVKRPKLQKTEGDRPRKQAAFSKPMQLSDALVAVCGERQLSRTDVVKKIWQYIRENQLKDPDHAKMVLCDEKLMAIFDGCTTVSSMGIAKYLSAHMTKIPLP